jgi:adenylate cyclase
MNAGFFIAPGYLTREQLQQARDGGDDERPAVMSALDMPERMEGVNEKLLARGLSQLPLGVSIATGEVVVAMLGSTYKRAYTVCGLTVNIAARLEKVAGPGQIIIGQATYRAVQDCIRVEKLRPVPVKGVTGPVQVYQVIGMR